MGKEHGKKYAEIAGKTNLQMANSHGQTQRIREPIATSAIFFCSLLEPQISFNDIEKASNGRRMPVARAYLKAK